MLAKIKICGITNLADGKLALELGADLLGFNFYRRSPRYVAPAAAADIISSLPTKTVAVGVFVNAGADAIGQVLARCPLDMVQLHGDENDADCRAAAALGVEVIKALRVRRREDISRIKEYNVETILLDAFREELYGGTGHGFDWSWISGGGERKILLAGGITPENIAEALAVGTYGIDLCSGVEKEPGIKDAGRMRLLFERIGKTRGA